MSVLYVLLPVGAVFAAGFLIAFVHFARRGQFDDLKTPAIRVLHEDPPARR
ncbi:cbb3-type cytochrome oxidase assembly protein CcoS [bacterium]|nr:cbb3-type cytochrome oxidase assembly protein CcoS [bacterium]